MQETYAIAAEILEVVDSLKEDASYSKEEAANDLVQALQKHSLIQEVKVE
ncbi:hypothetical protein GCM10008986_16330 [Salinibacillus aidingensis]|uniref:Uncharacterized protein n=1 Tax=Salinibacillus aidingensis TaxID=237684 RepID=A0ABP3L113_9BACI